MCSVVSATGVYRLPGMGWKTQQCKNKYLWGQKGHLTRLFSQVYTLESLFPVIIISLNIVEGSGILGQKISLFLQHTHTKKPQHIMFRRDSDTGNTLVPCGVKSCYTTSYGKFKPSFKYLEQTFQGSSTDTCKFFHWFQEPKVRTRFLWFLFQYFSQVR